MENLTKEELSKFVKEISQSPEFKKAIENEMKKNLNGNSMDKKILDASTNILTQLFKALWQKRTFWKSSLSTKPN